MRLPALLCALACLLSAAPGPVAAADRSCADLRQFYTGKGFTLAGVPQSEISGEFEGGRELGGGNVMHFSALMKSVFRNVGKNIMF